ncbi:hypothetical protein DFS34DRAFT_251035 [Phlyctochytrium arcticum]|nr:hypothetical protein DFS34DRAFT_251035 [Phlyctochytrium arcticum]
MLTAEITEESPSTGESTTPSQPIGTDDYSKSHSISPQKLKIEAPLRGSGNWDEAISANSAWPLYFREFGGSASHHHQHPSQFTSNIPRPVTRKAPLRRVNAQPFGQAAAPASPDDTSPAVENRIPSPRPLSERSPTPLESPAEVDSENLDEEYLLNPSNLKLCITSYPYMAVKNDELSFLEGQVIRVVRTVEGGWWEGQLDQRVGWFPANYVEDYIAQPEDLADGEIGPFANTIEELDDLRLRTISLNTDVQGSRSPPETEPVDLAVLAQEGHRSDLINSIIAAERQYLESLQNFMDEYVYPLYQVDWLPPHHHQAMFGNIEDVVDFEKEWITALEGCKETQFFGQCVLENADRFCEVYTEYCVNLPHAVTVCTDYGRNPFMTRFLQAMRNKSSPLILHMVSFLHKPAQWKDRSQAALVNLLRSTDPKHADYELLAQACDRISKIVQDIEQRRKRIENREIIHTLRQRIESWEGPALESYGAIVLEGTLKLLEGGKPRERKFFLFEKLLLIVRSGGNKSDMMLRVVEKLVLSPTTVLALGEQGTDETNLSFQLSYLLEDSKFKTLTIIAFNPQQKERWITALHAQLEGNVTAIFSPSTSGSVDDWKEISESSPQRPLKWFASWSARIRKKRPSLPNLKEYGEAMLTESGRSESEGNIFIRVIRKKDTRERLKNNESDQFFADTIPSELPVHAKHPSYPVPLSRASIISPAELAVPHHPPVQETVAAAALAAESLVQDGRRTTHIRAHTASSSRSSQGSLSGLSAASHSRMEPPPPMPPLPAIVKEKLHSRQGSQSGLTASTSTGALPQLVTRSALTQSVPIEQSAQDGLLPKSHSVPEFPLSVMDNARSETPLTGMTDVSQASSPSGILWMQHANAAAASLGPSRSRPISPTASELASMGGNRVTPQPPIPVVQNPDHHTLSHDSFSAPLPSPSVKSGASNLESHIAGKKDPSARASTSGFLSPPDSSHSKRQRVWSHPAKLEGSDVIKSYAGTSWSKRSSQSSKMAIDSAEKLKLRRSGSGGARIRRSIPVASIVTEPGLSTVDGSRSAPVEGNTPNRPSQDLSSLSATEKARSIRSSTIAEQPLLEDVCTMPLSDQSVTQPLSGLDVSPTPVSISDAASSPLSDDQPLSHLLPDTTGAVAVSQAGSPDLGYSSRDSESQDTPLPLFPRHPEYRRASVTTQLPSYDMHSQEAADKEGTRRVPVSYAMHSTSSMANLTSMNRTVPRKSSAATLVQAVRGFGSLFRRSKSSEALRAAKFMNASSAESSTADNASVASRQTEYQNNNHAELKAQKKSSFSDLKSLWAKAGRNRSKSSGQQAAAGGTPPFHPPTSAPASPVLPTLRTQISRVQPPAQVPSPHEQRHSHHRDSEESAYRRRRQSQVRSPTLQSVPMPSPLPSAPIPAAPITSLRNTLSRSIRAKDVLSVPGGEVGSPSSNSGTVGKIQDEESLRRLQDSGVYGLLNNAAGGLGSDVGRMRENSGMVVDASSTTISAAPAVPMDVPLQPMSIIDTFRTKILGVSPPTESSQQPNVSPSSSPPAQTQQQLSTTDASLAQYSSQMYEQTLSRAGSRHSRSKSLGQTTTQDSKPLPGIPSTISESPDLEPSSKTLPQVMNQVRTLRRARSNIAAYTTTTAAEDLKPKLQSVPSVSSPVPLDQVGSEIIVEEEEEDFGGPVIGRLEKAWYVDLVTKCESMAGEIRDLKKQLDAVSQKVDVADHHDVAADGVPMTAVSPS